MTHTVESLMALADAYAEVSAGSTTAHAVEMRTTLRAALTETLEPQAAQAIIDARDAQRRALNKPRVDHVEQFTRMAQARKDTDAFQALIDKGQPL